MVWRLSLGILLFLHLLLAPVQAEQARGPILVRDLFPLTTMLPTMSESGLRNVSDESLSFGINSAWSNTANRKGRNFTIDAETRLLDPTLGFRLDRDTAVRVALPLYWRGGGVLDEPIYLWHEALHLPQGPRDNAGGRDNLFSVTGITESGKRARLDREGFGVGDLDLSGFHQVQSADQSWLADIGVGIQLPTGASQFGLEGPAPFTSLLLERRYEQWSLYAGGQYSYLTDTALEDFRYNRHQGISLLGAEWKLAGVSAYVGLLGNFGLVENIRQLETYQLYLDTGVRIDVAKHWEVVLNLRENPAPEDGSADFTVFAGINRR